MIPNNTDVTTCLIASPDFGACVARSERQLQPELQLSRVELAQHLAESRVVEDASNQQVVGVIQRVEEFSTELEADAFLHANVAGQDDVSVHLSRSDQRVASDVAEPSCRRRGER